MENSNQRMEGTSNPSDFRSSDYTHELLSKLIIYSPYGYVVTDCTKTDSPAIYVNQAFQSLTGYTSDEIIGHNCRLLLGHDTEQSSLEAIRRACQSGHECTAVVRNYKKDGSLFYNELSMVPINDQDGNTRYCSWMLKDITDQIEKIEKLETDIALKGNSLNAYLTNSKEAIWRIDFNPPVSLDEPESIQVQQLFNNSIFTEANDVAAKIYGLKKGKDVIGMRFNNFMKISDPENLRQMTKLVQSNFRIDNLISKEISVDGTSKMLWNNITPSILNDKVISIWGTSLEVSDLFKTQTELKKSKKILKKKEKKLRKKNVALKELIVQVDLEKNQFKNRIIANIQHILLPYLDRIQLNRGGLENIEQLRKDLENLTSSFGYKISNTKTKLSPREIEICNLVKNGLSNKEISNLLGIALYTVQKHRRVARKKLGITNKKINLQTYLNSL